VQGCRCIRAPERTWLAITGGRRGAAAEKRLLSEHCDYVTDCGVSVRFGRLARFCHRGDLPRDSVPDGSPAVRGGHSRLGEDLTVDGFHFKAVARDGLCRRLLRVLPLLAVLLGLGPVQLAAQLVLADPARNLTVRIGGLIQFRYEYFDTPVEDLSSFYLRRLRLDLTGQFLSDRITYRILPEISRDATLRDGWVNYRASQALEVQAGQIPVPFQYRIAPARQKFAENGASNLAFGHATLRDLGVLIHGSNAAGSLTYALGVFDGAGLNTRRSNSGGNLGTGRASLALRGTVPNDEVDFTRSADNLVVGLGVLGASNNVLRDWALGRSAAGNREADWLAFTGDLQLQLRGLLVVVTGYHRSVSPSDALVGSYAGTGGDASIGYMLVPERLDAAVRFGRFSWDHDAPNTREEQWQAVMNLYHSRHALKTRVYFEFHRFHELIGTTSERVLVAEVQMLF